MAARGRSRSTPLLVLGAPRTDSRRPPRRAGALGSANGGRERPPRRSSGERADGDPAGVLAEPSRSTPSASARSLPLGRMGQAHDGLRNGPKWRKEGKKRKEKKKKGPRGPNLPLGPSFLWCRTRAKVRHRKVCSCPLNYPESPIYPPITKYSVSPPFYLRFMYFLYLNTLYNKLYLFMKFL